MNRPKIRDRFKRYRIENQLLREKLKINEAHKMRDVVDLETRIDELESDVRFYKNDGNRRLK